MSLLCRIYFMFLLFIMVSAGLLELTVEFNFNSMSTVIVLIVSIKIEELRRTKLLVLEQ